MPKRATRSPHDAWRRAAVHYIAEHPDRPLKLRALARELEVPDQEYPRFRALIREMIGDGTLALGAGRTVQLPEQAGALIGIVRLNRHGDARIVRAGWPDVLVRRGFSHGALDGDTVAARLLKRRGARGQRMAEVIRIIERAPIRWVGVLEQRKARWVVQPQGKAPAPLVEINDPTAKSARPGELVVVEPLEHTLGTDTVRGTIIEKLGEPSQAQTKILGVIRRHGLPDAFPADVRRAAQRTARNWEAKVVPGREDLRKLLTITIDPPDARDFDDAITLRQLDGGRVELGVHIADVAHFVKPGGVLDREAYNRGNSVYFPGFVVPMLPEVLSNGVCSLQPRQERYTKTAFITYDAKARVVAERVTNSVIKSDQRLTYDQVTDVLEGRRHELPAEIVQLIKSAEQLARRIRKRRLQQGMIVLTLPEPEIELNDAGEVADARPADTSFSHTVIEMFMVEANEAVCRALKAAGLPQLRRIHPPPDPERDASLRQLGSLLGVSLPERLDRRAMQRLLDEVRGTPAEAAANLLLLQSLAQACYSPSVEGHFALASEHYCHFTSPIRRYPDLVIHRLVNELVASQRGRRGKPEQRTPTTEQLVEIGEHTSATERRAQDAEREAIFLLLLDLMKQKVGEVLTGTVSGLASFGAFIRLQPYLAEGLVHVSELGPDDWDYDEQASMFVGRRSGKVIALGQSVKVLVAAVDELRQTITLVAAERGGLGVSGGRMQALQHRSRQRKKSVRKSARSERRGAKTARRGRQRRR